MPSLVYLETEPYASMLLPLLPWHMRLELGSRLISPCILCMWFQMRVITNLVVVTA